MSLFQVDFEGVPPASSLGYVLYAHGTALGPRTGAGILPADWPDSVTAGLQGGDYSVQVDTVATGADTLVWDTGGSSPQSASVSLSAPPLPVLATIAIPVTYAPNPQSAALDITEAGVDEGAYPCVVTGPAADGITYTLTASLTSIPAGLTPGPVSVQVGDIVDGVFVPAQVNGVAVPPSLGTLSMAGSNPAAGTLVSVPAPLLIDLSAAALTITQGTNTFGPYSALVTANSDGTNTLSLNYADLLSP